jgi:hypothetical protein
LGEKYTQCSSNQWETAVRSNREVAKWNYRCQLKK